MLWSFNKRILLWNHMCHYDAAITTYLREYRCNWRFVSWFDAFMYEWWLLLRTPGDCGGTNNTDRLFPHIHDVTSRIYSGCDTSFASTNLTQDLCIFNLLIVISRLLRRVLCGDWHIHGICPGTFVNASFLKIVMYTLVIIFDKVKEFCVHTKYPYNIWGTDASFLYWYALIKRV